MKLLVLASLGLALAAQTPAVSPPLPLRLVRGQVSEVASDAIVIRDNLMRPYRCTFAPGAERLAANGIQQAPEIVAGSSVDAIVEQNGAFCAIRTVYVRPPRPPLPTMSPRTQAMLDNLFPRGNLVYTGTVQTISDGLLELRLRRGERHRFVVRSDTTFSTGGRLVNRDQLEPQTMVQIRAGRAFGGELEVYQITWGDILPGH